MRLLLWFLNTETLCCGHNHVSNWTFKKWLAKYFWDAFGWSKKESLFSVHYLASIIIHSHDNIWRKWALFAYYNHAQSSKLGFLSNMPLWHFDQFYKRLAITYQTQYILKMKILQIHFHTMFENLPKSRIQHCERSELRLHFEWTKVN